MRKVINTEKKPIKLWLDNIEEGALQQAKNLANLPFLYKWIALMPDSHQGYGMPIGGVIACDKVVIPNAVGVDIGCGMSALKTSLKNVDNKILKKVMGKIRNVIPVGFDHHKEKQNEWLSDEDKNSLWGWSIIETQYQSSMLQIGTLGGGNHFIEIQKGSDGFIWIMIHSGSRNIGYKVAKYYNETAKNLNKRWFCSVPQNHELSFLPIEEEEAKKYMTEMKYCVDFAFKNRKLMMEKIIRIFDKKTSAVFTEIPEIINIAHNYASWENHYGKNVIVHRKGATLASEKTIGIIPGSQGTKSYIVEGLGNPESFKSCSHGAGRIMGRKEACRTLDLQKEINKLNKKGIIHGIRQKKDLDEASGAYKNIKTVMENQRDLVTILVELSPLGVIKG